MASTSALLQSWRICGSEFKEPKFCECNFCSESAALDSLFIRIVRLDSGWPRCLAFHTIIATARNPFRGESAPNRGNTERKVFFLNKGKLHDCPQRLFPRLCFNGEPIDAVVVSRATSSFAVDFEPDLSCCRFLAFVTDACENFLSIDCANPHDHAVRLAFWCLVMPPIT